MYNLSLTELKKLLDLICKLEIILIEKETEWLRFVSKKYLADSAVKYTFDNDTLNKLFIVFHKNECYIQGYCQDNTLNNYSDEIYENFDEVVFKNIPRNLKEFIDYRVDVSFAIWTVRGKWYLNDVHPTNDGGRDAMLKCLTPDSVQYASFAKIYHNIDMNPKILKQVFDGAEITDMMIYKLNRVRNMDIALSEIAEI